MLEEVQLNGGHDGLVFTGRSAGGAVASLAALSALCLSRSPHTRSPATLSSVLCITFGSSPLGNEPFARAVLREGWGGRFCHLVSHGDAFPRLLFCPAAASVPPEAVAHPPLPTHTGPQTSGCRAAGAASGRQGSPDFSHLRGFYRPFGSYLFCSARGGAVCVDNPQAIMKMLYLTSSAGEDRGVEEELLCYGALVDRLRRRSLLKGSVFLRGDGGLRPTSTPTLLEAGISVALEALGIEHHSFAAGQDFMGSAAAAAREAAECLRTASTIERTPSLNSADMAKELAGVTPWRAQIEWYKSSCDEHLGYYDAFKRRGISRRENHVNGNRLRLAVFWDGILGKLERNELPPDFPRRDKWVNASQFYKLLVEPLDIAEYYRNGKHRTVLGHYLGAGGGRARRYRVFDRWWEDKARRIGRAGMDGKRSRFASLTQDSCFWARVEEARDMAARARGERDAVVLRRLWEGMAEFERHATNLIERKEVSVDVLAADSSFRVWQEEWKRLKSDKAAQSREQEHPML